MKNTNIRLKRTLLGEIKEKQGKLYYTRQLRNLMNSVFDVQDFLKLLDSDKMKNYDYFYRQLFYFYKNAAFIVNNHEKITQTAISDIVKLEETIEKEIFDLKRYKVKINGQSVETYADRIKARIALKEETAKTKERLNSISQSFTVFDDFYSVLLGNPDFKNIGKCQTTLDTARFFYNDTIRKAKRKYKMYSKGLYKSDAYALCMLLTMLGKNLEPKFALVFVDEGQDISQNEYELLHKINPNASFNIFGDLKQNITSFRGLTDWKGCNEGEIYSLNENYRNTNQIVEYVAKELDIDMQPIGFDGPPVIRVTSRGISSFFRDVKGLKAIIVKPEFLDKYKRKSYNVLSVSGKISKNKINIMKLHLTEL
jgi:DNA helicase IV